MASRTLGSLIRLAVVVVAICLLGVAGLMVPRFGLEMVADWPEFAGWYWPWLVFAWVVTLPCLVVLYFVWRVSFAVSDETVFTRRTARWVKDAAVLVIGDAVLLLVGNVVLQEESEGTF